MVDVKLLTFSCNARSKFQEYPFMIQKCTAPDPEMIPISLLANPKIIPN